MTDRPPILELRSVPVERCVALRRNPQYVSPHGMEAMKESIRRDGFVAPVLLRPLPGTDDFEVVSGNHRVMAARELGLPEVSAVVGVDMTDAQAQRLAVNLNTIHGDPTAELLAPFLVELDADTLRTVHLSDELLRGVSELDAQLADTLANLDVPSSWDIDSSMSPVQNCMCPNCGRRHIRAEASEPDDAA